MVHVGVHHASLDLSDLSSEIEEHTEVIIAIGQHVKTAISAYIAPSGVWDTKLLEKIHKRSRGQLILCGDFNARNESWGGTRTDAR